MILIVGLGNPGEQYKNTRHNVGFMVLDEFNEANGFPPFESSKKYNGLVSQGIAAKNELILLKPQTFMNESGKAVKAVANFFKIKPDNIYVVHDEADVDLGKIKISQDSTAAGHKGAQSLIDELGTKKFTRFRVGINSNDEAYESAIKKEGLENVVLKNFSEEEEPIITESIKNAAELIISQLKENK
jgi:PTH1 family peptidyl-tRNA hydrolase